MAWRNAASECNGEANHGEISEISMKAGNAMKSV
jgi:hypothetical protein